jgi:DNA-binding GntR family transcriptional regulator
VTQPKPETATAAIVRAPDLRSQVYERLRDALRRGLYPADSRLLEHTVAQEYGVSRTPAREALALLARDGLLRQEGRGFRIPTLTQAEIADVFQVRRLLEPTAVALAAKLAAQEALEHLAALAEREFHEHGDRESYVGANERLRRTLFALCPNKRLVALIQLQEEQIALIRHLTLIRPAVRQLSVRVFSGVIEAVVRRDAEGAKARMEVLLDEAYAATIAEMAASATDAVPPQGESGVNSASGGAGAAPLKRPRKTQAARRSA